MNSPILIAEIPHGQGGHVTLASSIPEYSELQVATALREARFQPRWHSRDILSVSRATIQQSAEIASGRTAAETLMLIQVDMKALNPDTIEIIFKRLESRLESLKFELGNVDSLTKHQQLYISSILAGWRIADGFEQLQIQKGSKKRTQNEIAIGKTIRSRVTPLAFLFFIGGIIAYSIFQSSTPDNFKASKNGVNDTASQPIIIQKTASTSSVQKRNEWGDLVKIVDKLDLASPSETNDSLLHNLANNDFWPDRKINEGRVKELYHRLSEKTLFVDNQKNEFVKVRRDCRNAIENILLLTREIKESSIQSELCKNEENVILRRVFYKYYRFIYEEKLAKSIVVNIEHSAIGTKNLYDILSTPLMDRESNSNDVENCASSLETSIRKELCIEPILLFLKDSKPFMYTVELRGNESRQFRRISLHNDRKDPDNRDPNSELDKNRQLSRLTFELPFDYFNSSNSRKLYITDASNNIWEVSAEICYPFSWPTPDSTSSDVIPRELDCQRPGSNPVYPSFKIDKMDFDRIQKFNNDLSKYKESLELISKDNSR